MAMSKAPGFMDLTSAKDGRLTVSTMSAPLTASASVAAMLAPAAWYSSSEKWERRPAPVRISTFAPCLTSFFAVSGLIPMRGSSELSAGPPIVIIVAPSASSMPGHASTHAIGIEWVGRQDHVALRAG